MGELATAVGAILFFAIFLVGGIVDRRHDRMAAKRGLMRAQGAALPPHAQGP